MAGWASAPIPEGIAAEDERFHKFSSTTVHHLSEPVRMIGVYVDMLEVAAGSQLNGEALQSIEYLRSSLQQMQRLQQGLAEFASVSGKTSRPHSPVRLELPLRQALLNLDEEMKAVAAKVSFHDLPTVYGDFDRLQLVFEHLLKNAVQYSGDQTPEIAVTCEMKERVWVVEVRDNGPGIELEFQDRIFELYTRLHGKSIPGNGLGLAICRSIITGHGGKIWIDSSPGDGSSFCFTLPIHQS